MALPTSPTRRDVLQPPHQTYPEDTGDASSPFVGLHRSLPFLGEGVATPAGSPGTTCSPTRRTASPASPANPSPVPSSHEGDINHTSSSPHPPAVDSHNDDAAEQVRVNPLREPSASSNSTLRKEGMVRDKMARLGSVDSEVVAHDDTQYGVSEWLQKIGEAAGGSPFFRWYVAYLLLTNLAFVALLGYHYMAAATLHTFAPTGSPFFTSLAMLMTFVLVLFVSSTCLDLNVRLWRAWMAEGSLLLPEKWATRGVIHTALVVGLLVIPFFYAVGTCDTAVTFVGTMAYTSFWAFEVVFLLVWCIHWVCSVGMKCRAWRTAKDGEEEWQARRLMNPLAASEFGIDLLSVRGYTLHIVVGMAWVVSSLYILGVRVTNLVWAAVVIILVGGQFLLLAVSTPSEDPRKTAKHQQTVGVVVLSAVGLFTLLGCVASLLSEGPLHILANLPLLVASQGMLVRRHTAHLTNTYILPRDDDDEKDDLPPVTKWPPVAPFSFCCRKALPKTAPRRAADCGGLTAPLGGMLWYLTGFVVAFVLTSGYPSWFDEYRTQRAMDGTTAVLPPSPAPYAVCSMQWGNTTITDIAAATWGAYSDPTNSTWLQDKGLAILHGGHSGLPLRRAVKGWGSAVLFSLFRTVVPFVGLWTDGQQSAFRGAVDVAMGVFPDTEPDYSTLLSSPPPVAVAGYGLYGADALRLGAELGVPAVAFAPPGDGVTDGVVIAPQRAILPSIGTHRGFVQETHCDGSVTECQMLSSIACSLMLGCQDSRYTSLCT